VVVDLGFDIHSKLYNKILVSMLIEYTLVHILLVKNGPLDLLSEMKAQNEVIFL
jgi:hypothetical protein